MVRVHVRYFAAAKAAAGVGEEVRDVAGGTIGHLLAEAGFAAAPVFRRASFLVNGVSTTDHETALSEGDRIDVLPPFAGG